MVAHAPRGDAAASEVAPPSEREPSGLRHPSRRRFHARRVVHGEIALVSRWHWQGTAPGVGGGPRSASSVGRWAANRPRRVHVRWMPLTRLRVSRAGLGALSRCVAALPRRWFAASLRRRVAAPGRPPAAAQGRRAHPRPSRPLLRWGSAHDASERPAAASSNASSAQQQQPAVICNAPLGSARSSAASLPSDHLA